MTTPDVFSVDELLGESKPVFSFSIGEKVYAAFASADLPEKHQLRLLEAETEFAELNADLYPKITAVDTDLTKLNKDLAKLTDQAKPIPTELYLKIRKLQQQENSLNSQLVRPARNAIEAMCKLDKGTLEFLPIKATNKLYSKIMDSLYKPAEESTEESEGNDQAEPTESDSTAT